ARREEHAERCQHQNRKQIPAQLLPGYLKGRFKNERGQEGGKDQFFRQRRIQWKRREGEADPGKHQANRIGQAQLAAQHRDGGGDQEQQDQALDIQFRTQLLSASLRLGQIAARLSGRGGKHYVFVLESICQPARRDASPSYLFRAAFLHSGPTVSTLLRSGLVD